MEDPTGTDWRLQGQERYLSGIELMWRAYRQKSDNPDWDHDHCAFCWAKFMVDEPEALHAGYCTLDEYHWICKACFEDFRGRFGWKLISSEPTDV
jgi:hypothetical protein